MKHIYFEMKSIACAIILLCSMACSETSTQSAAETSTQSTPPKIWLSKEVHLERILPKVNTYHMFDTSHSKVGSMVFGFHFEDGLLVSRDTSQLDDGSIYEIMEAKFDTSQFNLQKLDVSIETAAADVLIDLQEDSKSVTGFYQISQDTMVNKQNIDSTYSHDTFRVGLYTLMHSINYEKNDSIPFGMLFSSNMQVINSAMVYEGEESIEVPAGKFDCDVIWLRTQGNILDNKIWITKEEPKKVVKFYVPSAQLDIELISSVNSN